MVQAATPYSSVRSYSSMDCFLLDEDELALSNKQASVMPKLVTEEELAVIERAVWEELDLMEEMVSGVAPACTC